MNPLIFLLACRRKLINEKIYKINNLCRVEFLIQSSLVHASKTINKRGKHLPVFDMGFFNELPLESQGTFTSRLCAQLCIILLLPRLLHFTLLQRIKQPRVVSEIVSGLILGPSCLGQIDGFTDIIFPARSIPFLSALAQLGVIQFLFMTGLHLREDIVWQFKWFAALASAVTIGLTFVIAPGIALAFDSTDYTKFNYTEMIIAIAALLSIPAEAVIARILAERGLLQSKLGSICMATNTIGLLITFILVATVLAMYGAENPWKPPVSTCPGTVLISPLDAASTLDPLWIVLVFFAFIGFLCTLVRYICTLLAKRVVSKGGNMELVVFVASMILCYAATWFTQTLTVSSLLGPFCLGLLSFPRIGTLCNSIQTALAPVTVGILLPIFFAIVGLRTNLALLGAHDVALAFLLFGSLWVTIFVGGWAVSFLWEGRGFKNLYFGTLLTCKGLTALTILNILFSAGTITPLFYSISFLYALISCAAVSPLMILEQKIREWRRPVQLEVHLLVDTGRIIVLPGLPHLAPASAFVAALISKSFEKLKDVLFLRLLDDFETLEQYISLLVDPISEDILAEDSIFGPSQLQWSVATHTPAKATYRGYLAPTLEATYLKIVNEGPDQSPCTHQIIGYNQSVETQRLILRALSFTTQSIVVCGDPLGGVTYDHSSRILFAREHSDRHPPNWLIDTVHSLLFWSSSDPADRPSDLQDCNDLRELVPQFSRHTVNDLKYDILFCDIPHSNDSQSLIDLFDLSADCRIPVVFCFSKPSLSSPPHAPMIRVEIEHSDEEVHGAE